MAIKFQFNKTSLHELNKQLDVRERALPTLQNKETALRLEVRRARDRANELSKKLEEALNSYHYMAGLWNEFQPNLIAVKDVELEVVKIAGVRTPLLIDVTYRVEPYNLFQKPLWYRDGVELLKELAILGIESEIYLKKMELLDYARKKTTQKVNLYEKVQIPGYQEAILKIKRFLEDEENLSKASQKIVKKRQQEEKV